MNAITVSVDYTDVLRISLAYNRHHFDRYLVVTSLADYDNVLPVAEENRADVFGTDAFYDDGAAFNKWKALEQGLDVLGRKDWLCLMDADVLWPKETGCWPVDPFTRFAKGIVRERNFVPGRLYTPLRRMWPHIPRSPQEVPAEETWKRCPVHQNVREWAGYSQIFHADDPVLERCDHCGLTPADHTNGTPDEVTYARRAAGCDQFTWHQLNWRHAGGADSFFQNKWRPAEKIRPDFEVLHLGPAGSNWCGRTTALADGTHPRDLERHQEELRALVRSRRTRRGYDNPTEKLL